MTAPGMTKLLGDLNHRIWYPSPLCRIKTATVLALIFMWTNVMNSSAIEPTAASVFAFCLLLNSALSTTFRPPVIEVDTSCCARC
jgi:hypothetical protein